MICTKQKKLSLSNRFEYFDVSYHMTAVEKTVHKTSEKKKNCTPGDRKYVSHRNVKELAVKIKKINLKLIVN